MLLLWFILIDNVRPLSFVFDYSSIYLGQPCGHLLGKSCPLGFWLVLFFYVSAVLIVGIPFPLVFRAGCGIRLYRFLIIAFLCTWDLTVFADLINFASFIRNRFEFEDILLIFPTDGKEVLVRKSLLKPVYKGHTNKNETRILPFPSSRDGMIEQYCSAMMQPRQVFVQEREREREREREIEKEGKNRINEK